MTAARLILNYHIYVLLFLCGLLIAPNAHADTGKPESDTQKSAPSRIEAWYAGRIVEELKQFGYDTLENKAAHAPPNPMGAVADDYILGTGDRLQITLRGQINDTRTAEIDKSGRLIIEHFAPLPAAGRRFADIREELSARTTSNWHDTQIYLALDAPRQIDVLLIGHVKNPGRKTLSVYHSVMDALAESGGIEKTGTLRRIKLIRDGRTLMIDLYGLLIHGQSAADIRLQDDDRIVIPPIGPTLAIAGDVKRPAIYEIPQDLEGMWHAPEERSAALSLNDALALAGGTLGPGENRALHLFPSSNGEEHVRSIDNPFAPALSDGSILRIDQGRDLRKGTIELAGAVLKPGIYTLDEHPSLARLLSDTAVTGRKIYPLFAVIERWDAHTMQPEYLHFSPRGVLQKHFDRRLADGDTVHLFDGDTIAAYAAPQENAKEPTAEDNVTEEGSRAEDPADDTNTNGTDLPPLLQSYIADHTVHVHGAVRRAGDYPASTGATLEDLIAAAGGFTRKADKARIEITSAAQGQDLQKGRTGLRREWINASQTDPADISLTAGDTVRVASIPRAAAPESVRLAGEIKTPGDYGILPGETLSELIERAGGLTDFAYPDGTIFSRESARRAERSRFENAARELEQAAARAATTGKDVNETRIALVRDLAQELKDARPAGRITVEADPEILSRSPELDIMLEPGDRIYIPRRPLNVRVTGEVLSPAALQFRSGKSAQDYIMEAGGFTWHADKDRAFVVYPDGSAQPVETGIWTRTALMIPPGSTLIVPRDPKPFDFIESARDITQILSNLALTGIWLDDIGDD